MQRIDMASLPRNHNDTLTAYAFEVVDLEAKIADLTTERDQYRELLSVSLEQQHRLTLEYTRLRICLHRDLVQRFGTPTRPTPTLGPRKVAA